MNHDCVCSTYVGVSKKLDYSARLLTGRSGYAISFQKGCLTLYTSQWPPDFVVQGQSQADLLVSQSILHFVSIHRTHIQPSLNNPSTKTSKVRPDIRFAYAFQILLMASVTPTSSIAKLACSSAEDVLLFPRTCLELVQSNTNQHRGYPQRPVQ